MRTVGRRWPGSAPRSDYVALCAYCGTHWRRSQLRVDAAGRLYCPQEGSGRDAVTLARLNAAGAQERTKTPPQDRGGAPRPPVDEPEVHYTTLEEIEL